VQSDGSRSVTQLQPSSTGVICEGRVVLVTGGGRGLGRAYALEFARQGASVVVNDIGVNLHGRGRSVRPAAAVAAEISALGGEAIVNHDDASDWHGAQRMIAAAVETFGRLDVVVNNAGFLRDRMFVNAAEDEWEALFRVHAKGHFCVTRWAARYWREQAKAGWANDARVINTTSDAGLFGRVGQAAYAAAKGAVLSLTLVQAAELAHYGVTVNAVAPNARTRMTEELFAAARPRPEGGGFDAMAPDNVAPLVVWLGSPDSAGVTGRVFEVEGGRIGVAEGWRPGPSVDKGARWEPREIGPAVRDLLVSSPRPPTAYGAQPPDAAV
jgi:NAD(P)-dependent dehydrogenase (short-subunit alcohol dehydrogenase family)